MKRLLIVAMTLVLLVTCCACGDTTTENTTTAAAGEYPFTAVPEGYPDVLLSAKSLEALSEAVAALSPRETASTTIETTEVQTTTAEVTETTQTTTTAQLTAVSTTQTTPTQAGNTSSPTALNNTEQAIFDLLVETLYRFSHPATVKVVKFYAYQEAGDRYFLSLTSMTDKGGYETKLYSLDKSGSCESIFSEFQIRNRAQELGLTTPVCDVGALNRALANYYTAQGWS